MTKFNGQQLKAINSNSPTILCIASPGSGKSSTLVARVWRLIQDGVNPAEICVITFTRAAAKELQERLGNTRIGFNGNLHSLMFRLLQQHGNIVGLPKQLTILDEESAGELLAECAASLKAKASSKALEELRTTFFQWGPPCRQWDLDKLTVKEYYSRLRDNGAVDFDSILHIGLRVIRGISSEPPTSGSWPYRHILVDETQDSSELDWDIYEAMPSPNKWYCGDFDQQIFSFRNPGGIGSRRILEMHQRQGTETICLEMNYRSRQNICAAASRLIAHNTNRIAKALVSTRPGGDVEHMRYKTQSEELMQILLTIRINYPATASGTASECAVIWRTNQMASDCKDYLKMHGVAVVERWRGAPKMDTATARAAVAVMMNPYNDAAAIQYIRLAKGDAAATKARKNADLTMTPVIQACFKQPFHHFADELFHVEQISRIKEGYGDILEMPRGARDCLESAAAKLTEPSTLGELWMALDEPREDEFGQGVTVCTAHAAKGREWPFVIVGGCEQETWVRKGEEVEECRRLFFVAATRAKDRLLLTNAEQRTNPFKKWIMDEKHECQFVTECLT